jgi:hypothetical protein
MNEIRLLCGSVALACVIVACGSAVPSIPDPPSDTKRGVDNADPTQGGGTPSTDAGPSASARDASPSAPKPADAGAADTTNTNPNTTAQDAGSTETEAGLKVTWRQGCWYLEQGHRYQAMQFQLTTSSPVPLEATLMFTTNCDQTQGTDNLNDTGGTMGSGSYTFWFIHHPDEMNTSAVWSFGNLKSACIDYSKAPDCQ